MVGCNQLHSPRERGLKGEMSRNDEASITVTFPARAGVERVPPPKYVDVLFVTFPARAGVERMHDALWAIANMRYIPRASGG